MPDWRYGSRGFPWAFRFFGLTIGGGMDLKLDISGLDAFKNAADASLAKIDMDYIGYKIANVDIPKQFDMTIAPNGSKWAAIKPREPHRNQNNRPLNDTYRLRNSFEYRVVGKLEVLIYTNVDYAAVHQFGTKKVKQRKILPTQDSETGYWHGVVQAYFDIR